MPMILSRYRSGYVFLVSVLFIGTIALATTVSLLLLGSAAERSSFTETQSQQALEWASTCIERALLMMRVNPTLEYTGDNIMTFPGLTGRCYVFVDGTGNDERQICAIGEVDTFEGSVARRLVADFETLFPLSVDSWKEVASHPLCDALP